MIVGHSTLHTESPSAKNRGLLGGNAHTNPNIDPMVLFLYRRHRNDCPFHRKMTFKLLFRIVSYFELIGMTVSLIATRERKLTNV